MSSYFVTGSGTDVGKTFAACAMLHGARNSGHTVKAYKPIAAGITRAAEADVAELLEACGVPVTEEEAAAVSPWRYEAAMSPNMAAALEGRKIDFHELAEWSRGVLKSAHGLTLIEGVGGVMVPLDEHHTVRDWIEAIGLPVILVTGNYLGAINHTLTAMEAIKAAKLRIEALVISESEGSTVPLLETQSTLEHFTHDIPLIIAQPRVSSWKEATDLHALGEKLA